MSFLAARGQKRSTAPGSRQAFAQPWEFAPFLGRVFTQQEEDGRQPLAVIS
jgi:hypothetical protein